MPEVGEIRSASSLGYKQSCSYVWSVCADCGNSRWMRRRETTKSGYRSLCQHCSARRVQAEAAEHKRVKGLVFKHASELDYKGRYLCYLDVCPNCGQSLWRPRTSLGRPCLVCKHKEHGRKTRGARNGNWKGGRRTSRGYTWITLSPDSPYRGMARKADCDSYSILEHRLVMAQHLGRCLESWEVVHHINGVKGDNRISNLELLPDARHHTSCTRMEIRIRQLEQRVTILEAENTLLKSQSGASVDRYG